MRNLKIKNKVILMIVLVAMLTNAFGFLLTYLKDINNEREELLYNSTMNARLVGEYCVSGLLFNRMDAADDALTKLESIPSILSAYVISSDGNLFASYPKNISDSLYRLIINSNKQNIFFDDYVLIQQPIVYDKQNYGTIVICVSTKIIEENLNKFALRLIVGMTIILIFTYFLAFWLQNIISKPITNLTGAIKKVYQQNNYSIRVQKEGNDEISNLYDEINYMLDQIDIRSKERDKAESALRESEEKFRTVADTINSAIFILRNDEFIFINKGFSRITGYTFEEIRKMKIENLIVPEMHSLFTDAIKVIKNHNYIMPDLEVKIKTKSNSEKWMDFSFNEILIEKKSYLAV